MKTTLEIQATEKDAQCLLEALQALDARFNEAIAVSSDERQIALLQNDQACLRLLLDDMKRRSLQLFGNDILDYDRFK